MVRFNEEEGRDRVVTRKVAEVFKRVFKVKLHMDDDDVMCLCGCCLFLAVLRSKKDKHC